MTLRARILGAAAGGGLPQWNCGCENCNLARAGKIPSQTQSSVAFSGNGSDWAILNASPDIRDQMARTPELHPTALRELPLRSVMVTNGDIDHIAGLLSLREQTPFRLMATGDILEVLAANRIFDAVNREKVVRDQVFIGKPFDLLEGLTAEIFPVPGKVPLFMEGETVVTDLEGEQTVGLRLEGGGLAAYYIPGCAVVTDAMLDRLQDADMLFFDGTVWDDDEMIRTGTGVKTGRRMGHVPISGDGGSLERLAGLTARKTYIHINNTNPILQPQSRERASVLAAGWEIAQDGQEIMP